MEISLTRHGASVHIVGDDATLTWMLRRTTYGFGPAIRRGEDDWTVIAGSEHASNRRWTRYIRRYASGETCSFLVDGRHRLIVVDQPPGAWRSLYALRMVRNVLRWELFRRGAIYLHASCVSLGGQGLAFIGPRRSGKSSLMVSALRSGSWEYVTEDDLTLLPMEGGGFAALGWPGSLRVRRSMLSHYPEIAAELQRLEHPANRLEENLDPEIGMVRVFPEELAHIFGCKITAETTLRWVARTEWGESEALMPIDHAALLVALQQSWDVVPERKAGASTGAQHGKAWKEQVFDPFLFEVYGVPDLSEYRVRLENLAASIEGYRLIHSGVLSASLSQLK